MTRFRSLFFPAPPAFGAAWLWLLLILFALPLAIVPAAADSFVLSKEVLFQSATAILAGLTAMSAAFGRSFRLLFHPLNGALLALLAWMALSWFWAVAPVLAAEELFRTAVLALFFLCFQALVLGGRDLLLLAIAVLLASSTAVAAWVVVQDFRAAFAPESLAVRATLGDWRDALSAVALGNTSHIGDFLAFGFLGWLTAALLAKRRRTKAVVLGVLWLHAAGLIVSWSVHSNLSVIVGTTVLFALLWKRLQGRWLRHVLPTALFAAAGWALVLGFYAVEHPLNPHGSAVWAPKAEAAFAQAGIAPPEGGFSGGIFSQAFASPRWQAGWPTRVAIWLNTLEIITQNPWLGTGAGTFTYSYPAVTSAILANDPDLAPYAASWTNAAHNSVLQFWAEMGVIGAAILLVLAGIALKGYTDRLRNPELTPGNAALLAGGLAALAAMAVQMQMNFPLQLPVGSVLFLLLLGLPMVLSTRGLEDEAMVMPVERPFGPIIAIVRMRNMAYPTEAAIKVDPDVPAVRWGFGIFSVAIGAALALVWLAPLRADIAYRPVYDRRQLVAAGQRSPTEVAAMAENVLAIWPDHVDARSGMQDLLLQAGAFERVVQETPLVLEKLNSTEVYLRRAIALEQLGRSAKAAADWDVIFGRNPALGRQYPRAFADWQARNPPLHISQ